VCSIKNDNTPVGFRVGTDSEVISGKNLLLGRNPIVHAAILGRKSWFLRNSYDVTLRRTEDYELWLRSFLANDFRIKIINEPLYYYREEGSATVAKLLSAYSSQRDLYSKYGRNFFAESEMAVLFAKSLGKSFVVRALGTLGKLDLMVKRRNKAILDDEMFSFFEKEIFEVLNFQVPGFEP
jgi:hypothetical protein